MKPFKNILESFNTKKDFHLDMNKKNEADDQDTGWLVATIAYNNAVFKTFEASQKVQEVAKQKNIQINRGGTNGGYSFDMCFKCDLQQLRDLCREAGVVLVVAQEMQGGKNFVTSYNKTVYDGAKQ